MRSKADNRIRSTAGCRGFSLVELLVVITIIVVISAMAIVQFGGSRSHLSRQNVAIELKNAFERARFDSVKRRATSSAVQAKVIISESSFTLVTDNNANGVTTDGGDSVVTDLSGRNAAAAHLSESVSFPVTVSFNERGEAVVTGATTPSFRICDSACTESNNDPAASTIVLVTPTGTVNLLAGGSSVPTFAAPSPITSVAANTDIRRYVSSP